LKPMEEMQSKFQRDVVTNHMKHNNSSINIIV
jgi:hypothetical protein